MTPKETEPINPIPPTPSPGNHISAAFCLCGYAYSGYVIKMESYMASRSFKAERKDELD